MADDFCAPFAPCPDIDGRLLVRQTFQGPAVAREEGAIPMGGLALHGAELRPFLDVFFLQRWVVKEACYAPVRSVMGLAPGETVTIEVDHREQVEYSRLVQDAVDRRDEVRRTRTRTEEFRPPASSGGGGDGGGGGGGGGGLGDAIGDAVGAITNPIGAVIDLFGSIGFGTIGQAVGAIQHTGDHTMKVIQQMMEAVKSQQAAGSAGLLEQSLRRIDESLETIHSTESHHLTATRTTRTETVSQRIRRTFSNPYRDRSLELRFIPVFRRMEVITSPFRGVLGLALNPGRIAFPRDAAATRFGHILQRVVADTTLLSTARSTALAAAAVPKAARGAKPVAVNAAAVAARASDGELAAHLDANAATYAPRVLAAMQAEGARAALHEPIVRLLGTRTARGGGGFAPVHTLDWSQAMADGGAVKVPFAEADAVAKGFGLGASAISAVAGILDTLKPGRFETLLPQPRRKEIRLFMGTHVEAVAGNCVLADLPPLPG